MPSRARELLLELYLLKLRYTKDEVSEVLKLPLMLVEDDLRRLLLAVDRLAPTSKTTVKKSKHFQKVEKTRLLSDPPKISLEEAVSKFCADLLERRVLADSSEYRGFLQSIGIRNSIDRSKATLDRIRARLLAMDPSHAIQHIEAARSGSFSGTTPYLELAKTLIGS